MKDVVGYDILGHCYFTEDGPEERNTFDHCLGLMVRAGTLLPSDRDGKMCRDIKEGAYPGYVPNPRQDCRYVFPNLAALVLLAQVLPFRKKFCFKNPSIMALMKAFLTAGCLY